MGNTGPPLSASLTMLGGAVALTFVLFWFVGSVCESGCRDDYGLPGAVDVDLVCWCVEPDGTAKRPQPSGRGR